MPASTKSICYSIILMLSSFQFGFVLNYGGLPIESLKSKYPEWNYTKDKTKIDFFINFASLFGSFGGFAIRFLCLLIPGRRALFTFCFFNFIFWLLYLVLSPTMLVLGIVLRSLQGLITGGTACLTPILMTNIASDDTIGMFGCINQLGIVIGMVVFSFIGSFVDYKIMAGLGAIFSALFCGLIWIVPEEKVDKNNKESLFQRKYALNIFIGIMLMVFQQFCGMNALMTEMPSIMQETGLNIDGNLQSALSTSTQLVSVWEKENVGLFNLWNCVEFDRLHFVVDGY